MTVSRAPWVGAWSNPLRTRGGRSFYEGDGVEWCDGPVQGAADVGRDEPEPDGAEDVAAAALAEGISVR